MQRREVLGTVMGAMGWLVAVGAVGTMGLGATQARAATEWKLATGYKPETIHTQNIEQFARDVEKATAGDLKISVHPNNTLFKLPEILGAVQTGKVEAGEMLMSAMVKDVPLAGADSVPFIVTSYKDAHRLWQYQAPLMEKLLAEKGVVPLFSVAWPPQGLFTAKPVRSKADFQGLKMRTYNATTVRIAELLGAQAVDVAAPDIPKALASGQIDSMITSSLTGVESQIWTHTKYYYELNAWIPKNLVFVQKKALDALTPATRKAVMEAAKAAEERGWAMSEAALRASVNEMRNHGMTIDRVPPELGRDINRFGEKFSREWVRTVGNDASRLFVPFYTQAP
jgi:TRAP-type C4-dicarboxylate transport system substrate-binding protein